MQFKTSSSLFCVLLFFFSSVQAQEKWSFDGYVSTMGQGSFSTNPLTQQKLEQYDFIVHNRMNVAYYASEKITAKVQFRNQFLWGESLTNAPNYASEFAKDRGWIDLNTNWWSSSNTLLNTQVDRAFVDYLSGNFEASIGRQRVNWGRTLVWNPNDLFNTFSYYDFDYAERPGSDAIRTQYYLDYTSSLELVAKIDSASNVSIAGAYKANLFGYDWQIIGGYVNEEDFVVGGGWEGNLKQFGFRGEFSYYHPIKKFNDRADAFLASLSLDYLFPKSISAQIEFLYNDKNHLINLATNPNAVFSAPSSSKSLSFSEYNLFASIACPVTPILNVSIAGMYYPDFNGYFVMPTVEYSLTNDLYLSVIYQYFDLEHEALHLGSQLAFARLKWSF